MLSKLASWIHPIACEWPKWLVRLVWVVATAYLIWLAAVVVLRVSFPWDLNNWSESPFLTNMLKLEAGQPVYGPPADANSFVYSPGLEYLALVTLKPFCWQLDIRFCRALNVLCGLLAGVMAGGVFRLALRPLLGKAWRPAFAWLGAIIAVLVIFRNFTSDTAHPDNLVMLHVTGLWLLTLAALQRQSFGLAVATVLFAAVGVLAKQILLLAFVGPVALFAWFNPWGWRKWRYLAGLGALAAAGVLAWLWLAPWGRFYTLDVLSRQGLHLAQVYWGTMELLSADRALLAVLALAALLLLWREGPKGRHYVTVWLAIGMFAVWPNLLSYLKVMGAWNNLVVFELWLFMLVWPAAGLWLEQVGRPSAQGGGRQPLFDALVAPLLALFLILQFPRLLPPSRSMYACCEAVQQRVTADLRAGRRILVAHGTMYQLHAGVRQVPLDRANSLLELNAAGLGGLTHTLERIRGRYYDRIYLTIGGWYGPAILSQIESNYLTDCVIPRPAGADRNEFGRALELLGDCRVLSPRPSPSPSSLGRAP